MQQTERLISQENVFAITGCYQSNVAMPTTALADRHGVPYLVANPIADEITQRGLRYVFRVAVRADAMAHSQIEFLVEAAEKQHTPLKTAAMLFENTQFGQSSSKGQLKYLLAAGVQVVGELPYASSGTDYTAIIARLRKLDPDVVLLTSYTPDAVLLARTMGELNYTPRLALLGSTAGHQDPDLITALGPLAEGVLTFSYWNADIPRPGAVAFNEGFRARFGQDPVPQCLNARTALWVIKDAIEKAGVADRERLREQLAATSLSGDTPPLDAMPYSALRFDASGENVEARGIVMQVQDGRFHTVWPKKMARRALRWPLRKKND